MPKRRRSRYPSDLTGRWSRRGVPDAAPGGRSRKAEKREVLEAIRYLLQAGCAWRLLPRDFPPWQTVYITTTPNARTQALACRTAMEVLTTNAATALEPLAGSTLPLIAQLNPGGSSSARH